MIRQWTIHLCSLDEDYYEYIPVGLDYQKWLIHGIQEERLREIYFCWHTHHLICAYLEDPIGRQPSMLHGMYLYHQESPL